MASAALAGCEQLLHTSANLVRTVLAELLSTHLVIPSHHVVRHVVCPPSPPAGCVVLFTVANLVKKVLIKLLSTSFHRDAHFNRMQEALRKVRQHACTCARDGVWVCTYVCTRTRTNMRMHVRVLP